MEICKLVEKKTKMAPQFSREQRNFLVMEYHKCKGHRDFLPQLVTQFQNKFPGARAPSFSAIRRVYKKQMLHGTVNNCNSSSSPGVTHSGRPRTVRTPGNFRIFWCQFRHLNQKLPTRDHFQPFLLSFRGQKSLKSVFF